MRWIPAVLLLALVGVGASVLAQDDSFDRQRVAEAQRRMEQRQREAASRPATPPATGPTRAAAGPASRPATTQPAKPRKVVFVLDTTGSMISKMAFAKPEILK